VSWCTPELAAFALGLVGLCGIVMFPVDGESALGGQDG
jgi:hypothetical protein